MRNMPARLPPHLPLTPPALVTARLCVCVCAVTPHNKIKGAPRRSNRADLAA